MLLLFAGGRKKSRSSLCGYHWGPIVSFVELLSLELLAHLETLCPELL